MNHWTEAETRQFWDQVDIFLRLCRVINDMAAGRCATCGRSELHFHALKP